MKKFTLTLCALAALVSAAYAGTERYSGKESKAVEQAPCPTWYGDNEIDIGIWGAFGFEGSNSHTQEWYTLFGDTGWGGGLDAKFFFARYFGIGVEGFGIFGDGPAIKDSRARRIESARSGFNQNGSDSTGGAFGTFTLRYPYQCSHWSPYLFFGGGAVFSDDNNILTVEHRQISSPIHFKHVDGGTRLATQIGLGMEYRFTRHIGLKSDFAWNLVDGRGNNFGLVRTGINFAF